MIFAFAYLLEMKINGLTFIYYNHFQVFHKNVDGLGLSLYLEVKSLPSLHLNEQGGLTMME